MSFGETHEGFIDSVVLPANSVVSQFREQVKADELTKVYVNNNALRPDKPLSELRNDRDNPLWVVVPTQSQVMGIVPSMIFVANVRRNLVNRLFHLYGLYPETLKTASAFVLCVGSSLQELARFMAGLVYPQKVGQTL